MTNATPETAIRPHDDWSARVAALGPVFADRAAAHDRDDLFVAANFDELKRDRFFSAGVPGEYGGGGLSHPELCGMLRELARFCPSTALSLSMHQHLVAATVWKVRHGQGGEALLTRIAERQLVLISTGARDWLASNGRAERVEGGYRVSARKAFASGSPAGDMLVTSVPFDDPEAGAQVLHIAIPFTADGVRIEEDWRTMGMRGTGSHSVLLDGVFVPEENVSLRRPQGVWHPVWSVVLGVAMPLIMSVYVGAAEAAADIALERARRHPNDPGLPYLVGEMESELTTAQLALEDMIRLANDYDFQPSPERASATLTRKSLCARAVLATGERALDVAGGAGFYRDAALERFLRDLHAARFHPLPEKQQQRFSGRLKLGLDPVG